MLYIMYIRVKHKHLDKGEPIMKIITNNHWREIEYKDNEDSGELESCFTYQGQTWFLSEFLRFTPPSETGYHGYHGLNAFAALYVKLSDDGDAVKVARAIS